MKTLSKVTAALVAGLLWTAPASAELVDKVAAVVNDDVIALSEVEQRAAPELNAANQQRDPKVRADQRSKALKSALDQLISEKLMEKEMDDLGITVTDQELELGIEDVQKQNNMDPASFEQALQTEGYTMAEYRDFMRKHLRRLKLVNLKVRGKVKMSDKDLQAEYDKYVRMEQADPEVHARHILVSVAANASKEQVDKAYQKAKALAEEARKPGVDFTALAKAKSEGPSKEDGGDLGFFRRGVMVPEFDKVAFSLPEGAVSEPVRSRFGWHVIKVEEKRLVGVKSFDEMKPELQDRLMKGQLEKYTEQYVKELKQKATIEVKI